MFSLDKDMSSFPVVTWHCPKYKGDQPSSTDLQIKILGMGCPASFTTRIMNTDLVRKTPGTERDRLRVARSLSSVHGLENIENIECHRNHR